MDIRIVNTMHDEIIVEVRVEIAEKVADILKESMVKAFEKLPPGVPFPNEGKSRVTLRAESID
jgi:DNA polymerase I-like protein with 3'-5' exonuclease and polymerase domains